jgi:2-deoxy-D-gluconate 3-dehydrogenase
MFRVLLHQSANVDESSVEGEWRYEWHNECHRRRLIRMNAIQELFDLTNKVAIVTGAAKGIGEAIAIRLAQAGASVLAADLDIDGSEQVASKIRTDGGSAQSAVADVGNVPSASRLIDVAVDVFGRVDILVNNAGIFPFSPMLQTSEQLWDKVMAINLKGAFFLTQAAAQRMIEANNGGKIVNIASIDAFHPTGNLVHYDASKGALVMATKSIALELGRYGINVNAVAPGSIRTPGAQTATQGMQMASGMTIEDMGRAFAARIPLGRTGEPGDIANATLFLASSAADYITGEVLVVDGGYLLS